MSQPEDAASRAAEPSKHGYQHDPKQSDKETKRLSSGTESDDDLVCSPMFLHSAGPLLLPLQSHDSLHLNPNLELQSY